MDEAAALAKAVAERTEATPVVNKSQFEKIQKLISAGIKECTLVAGGEGRPENHAKGFYVKPTVFSHVLNTHEIAREEIFGPVLSILAYDSLDEAIEIANATPYGLAGYVSGVDSEQLRRVAREIRAGNIQINGAPSDFNASFGGYKQSGNGREWGAWGFDDFTEVKSVVGWNGKELPVPLAPPIAGTEEKAAQVEEKAFPSYAKSLAFFAAGAVLSYAAVSMSHSSKL